MDYSKKTIDFLKSIKIENIEDFDIHFLSHFKSKFDENYFIFQVEKDSPWDYQLLDEFLRHLENIKNYKYEFNFTYKFIDDSSLINVVSEWIFNKTYENNFEINIDNKTININLFSDELYDDFKNKYLKDLKSLFKFISYNYEFNLLLNNSIVIEKKEEEKKDDFIDDEINTRDYIEEFNTLSDENISADEYDEILNDSLKKDDEIKQEKESYTIEMMKKNYDSMINERKNKNIFKHGDYKYLKLHEIDKTSECVDVNGKVFQINNLTTTKKGNLRLTISIYDDTDAINVILISGKEINEEDINEIKLDQNVRIKGRVISDDYKKSISIMAHNISFLLENPLREDLEEEKRVELHLHTNMSEMDGISSIEEYIKTAKNMGHSAIALTDHGSLQSYPEAQKASKENNVKVLYGCEFYMINDYLTGCLNPQDINLADATYVVFDLESTGLSILSDKITEFGAVKIKNGIEIDRIDILINPGIEISKFIEEKTHITNEMVKDKPKINEVLDTILDFFEGSILISHNIEFDYNMVNQALIDAKRERLNFPAIDTLQISRYLFPESAAHNLGALCRRLEVDYDTKSAHRADYDAKVLALCWIPLLDRLTRKDNDDKYKINIKSHKDLEKLPVNPLLLNHYKATFHLIALAKNKEGLKSLYKLVTESYIDYQGTYNFIPRSHIEKYRKDLLLGSACFNGEVFYSCYRRGLDELKKAISFYDYIEIQPLTNYSPLINNGDIKSEETLKYYIKLIIDESLKQNKLICATGDTHYCDPKDKIIRDIFIENEGVGKTRHPLSHYDKEGEYYSNPDQHYKSTKEMLDDFAWLGEENAKEFVIKNTNIIASLCDFIEPIPSGLYPPTIENSDKILKDLCYSKAKELYGDPLPEYIDDRLATELKGIISNGYAVIYYISHLLVKKSNDAGYIVGSRGSVGSSFAATMAGITEVNPLPAHYRCPKCRHFEFANDPNVTSGFDLEDKMCPECGEKMIKDGQNIPFQTFLGFQAEKVPDIDLNFPTDFQAEAHLFTRELLGEDSVYRAGTIQKVKLKTAIGYVRTFYKNLKKSLNDYNSVFPISLAYRCQNVKKTTGQHPGGIIVIPKDYEVYDFTPLQYPAGDKNATRKTTHFDFKSIHDTVLKFDMLGHVDPQAVLMLSKVTGVDGRKVPLDDKKVISIFSKDDALNMQHKYMKKDNGALGIPEFGTGFVRQLLRETNPTTVKDLIIVSGLSHGTNVWANNAQTLISENITDLRGVIGCRDDIMTYLISKGIPPHESFMIMEKVRKGKKLSYDEENLMRSNGVPEYYIGSCKKIHYLFPKGHACAYVMMALRIAYYKVYYPLEYYAVFFTLRCDAYDINSMINGIDVCYEKLKDLERRKVSKNPEEKLSNKEKDLITTLQVVLEMYERGYKLENIDIEKSDPNNFIVDKENNGIICPFKVIDGLGESSCVEFLKARAERPFSSKDDLRKRGKFSQTIFKELEKLGVLDSLDEDDQLTLFNINSLF